MERLRFGYFGIEPDTTEAKWLEHWSAPYAPLAVKIALLVGDNVGRAASHTTVIALSGASTNQESKEEKP